MNKIITTVICIHIAAMSFAQDKLAGRLKVSIETIKCIKQSWDGLIEFDGHGNEVSVNYSYRIYTPANPGASRKGAGGTPIFGSAINGMTRAGTQTPNLGGIKNGDIINVSKLLIDDRMNADDYIIIAPSVWEWDADQNNTFRDFNRQLETDLDWVITQTYPFANTEINSNDPFNGRTIKIFDKYRYGPATKYQTIFQSFLCPSISQGSKPVDVRSGSFNGGCLVIYPPTLIVLDTRVLNALFINNKSSQYREGPNYITGINIPFVENTYAVTTSNGSYSIFLKIEFIPDPVASNSGPTGRPTRINTNINKGAMIKGNNNLMIGVSPLIGTWNGTQTNDYGQYPQAVSFELTKNGEYLVKDVNGTLASKGSYTFSNNTVTGSYKQLSSGETFSFTGTYDPATQKLNCSQGPGSSTTGQGKWVVTKK